MSRLWVVEVVRSAEAVVYAETMDEAEALATALAKDDEFMLDEADATVQHELTSAKGYERDHVYGGPDKATVAQILEARAEAMAAALASGTHPLSPAFRATADLFPPSGP